MKKLIPVILVLLVASSIMGPPESATAQDIIKYFGGQMLIASDSSHGIGAGTMGGAGVYLSDNMILWGQVENEKAHSGDQYDFYLAGTTFLYPGVVEKLRMGLFMTVAGGLGGLEDDVQRFSTSLAGGSYFALQKEKKINLYAGGGYSYVEGFKTYSIHLGISWVEL